MPSFPIAITDSQHQPVNLSQLTPVQRRTLLEDIKEGLFQVGVPQAADEAARPENMLGDDWSANYEVGSNTFTLQDLPDNKVNIVRQMQEIELKDFGGAFGGETHYAKVVVPPNGGRRRKTRKGKGKKSRKTRRGVSRR